jgi:protease-4
MPQDIHDPVVQALLTDRRSDRRWRNIRFFSGCALVAACLLVFKGSDAQDESSVSASPANAPYASLVRVNGEIGPGKDVSAAKLNPLLQKAFEDKNSKGVILLVNSPGGTPVQATLIHDRILQLRRAHPDKHIVVVGEDTLASGAYLMSVAAEKIYVADGTVTGSIGVISSGFGFDKALATYGVERRVFHAGSHKDRLDSFEPLDKADTTKMQGVLDRLHAQFIQVVKDGRGKRLHGDEASLFSGDFWTGDEAVQLGLADGIGDVSSVAEKEFHVKVFREYAAPAPFWEQAVKKVTSSLPVNLGEMTRTSIEAKAPGF